MGDDKVRESPAEVFATVAEVNSVFHSLEDMLGTRFEAIDGRFGVLDEKLMIMMLVIAGSIIASLLYGG